MKDPQGISFDFDFSTQYLESMIRMFRQLKSKLKLNKYINILSRFFPIFKLDKNQVLNHIKILITTIK